MNQEITKKDPSAKTSLNTEIIPQENSLANDYDIDAFLEKRKDFITKVNKIMVEGKDYHVIQGKKSLAKGGAEKIASIFGWTATFSKDEDVAGAFKLDGLIAFVCKLSKSGQQVGEGRGASLLTKNGSDPNKTIKMAQKSAFIDAVLRSSGLSDFFTQDLEDMKFDDSNTPAYGKPFVRKNEPLEATQTPNPAPTATEAPKSVSEANKDKPMTDKQKTMIKSLMKQKGISNLSEAGIEKIENPTMLHASMIIKKLMTHKVEDTITYDEKPKEIIFDKEQIKTQPYTYPERD